MNKTVMEKKKKKEKKKCLNKLQLYLKHVNNSIR